MRTVTAMSPCHVPALTSKDENIIPMSHKSQRWVISAEANRPVVETADSEHVRSTYKAVTSHMRSPEQILLNGTTKWKAVTNIARRAVDSITTRYQNISGYVQRFEDCRFTSYQW